MRRLATAVIFVSFFFGLTGKAQFYVPSFEQTSMSMYLSSSYLTSQNLQSASQALLKSSGAHKTTNTVVKFNKISNSAKKLAQSYPPEKRHEAEKTFQQLFATYHAFEDKLRIPKGDVGAALAFFLAVNYASYKDVDVVDKHFLVLIQQITRLLSENQDFQKVSAAGKLELYEQLSTLGMLMAGTREGLKRKPDAELKSRLQKASHEYLKEALT